MYQLLDKKNINDANKKIQKLLIDIVDTKTGGINRREIQHRTFKLRKSIKTFLIIKNDKMSLNVEAVEYFQYLDVGSIHIRNPWFFINELTESVKFKDIIKVLHEEAVKKLLESKL